MQNGSPNNSPLVSDANAGGRLLGFVRVQIGSRTFNLPVQALQFEKDGDRVSGGLFIERPDSENEELGILVDDAAPATEMQAQIEKATAEAVRHLSRKVLN